MKLLIEIDSEHIDVDPLIRSGDPVITGTRYPIGTLFSFLADTDPAFNIREIADDTGQNLEALQQIVQAVANAFRKGKVITYDEEEEDTPSRGPRGNFRPGLRGFRKKF